MSKPMFLILAAIINLNYSNANAGKWKSVTYSTVKDNSNYVLPNENVEVFKSIDPLVEKFEEHAIEIAELDEATKVKTKNFEKHLKSSNISFQFHINNLSKEEKYDALVLFLSFWRNQIRKAYVQSTYKQTYSEKTDYFEVFLLNYLHNKSIFLFEEFDLNYLSRISLKFIPIVVNSNKYYALNICFDSYNTQSTYLEKCVYPESKIMNNQLQLTDKIFFVSPFIFLNLNTEVTKLNGDYNFIDKLINTRKYKNVIHNSEQSRFAALTAKSEYQTNKIFNNNPLNPIWKNNEIQIDISSILEN